MADGRDMPHATFVRPDLGSFCRLDELGLQVAGQRLEPGRAVLACRIVETDEFARWCRRCGGEAAPRDSVTRRLAHEPLGWRPTTLLITIRRYRCTGCGHVWRQDTSRAAEPRAKLSRRALRWAPKGIVCQHLTVARVSEGLGVSVLCCFAVLMWRRADCRVKDWLQARQRGGLADAQAASADPPDG